MKALAHGTPVVALRLRTPPWTNIARRNSRSLDEISGLNVNVARNTGQIYTFVLGTYTNRRFLVEGNPWKIGIKHEKLRFSS